MRTIAIAACAILACGGVGAASAWAAEAVVFRAHGTSAWRPGQKITATTVLDLPAGAEVRAVTEETKVLVVTGPFHGRLAGLRDGPASGLLAALQSLLLARQGSIAALIRGETPAAIDPWVIDLTTGGPKCLRDVAGTRLWQPEPPEATSIFFTTKTGRLLVPWPEHSETISWPADLPLAEGGSYQVEIPDRKLHRLFSTHFAPHPFDGPLPAAAWMLSNQCNAQALALLDTLPVEPAGRPVPEAPAAPPKGFA